MGREDLLFGIADGQQGYFTSKQALTCGYYDPHFQRYIAAGKWLKVGRGVYRLAHYPAADRPDLVEWSLWSRNKKGEIQGVWSHETALDFYDLCDIMPAKLHMTVPKHFRKIVPSSPILKLYFADLQKGSWIEQQGYRITTPLRTLLDLAETRQISDELLEQAVREGRKRGILTQQQIESLPKGNAELLLKKFYGQR